VKRQFWLDKRDAVADAEPADVYKRDAADPAESKRDAIAGGAYKRDAVAGNYFDKRFNR
jgi:hypothetical protein